jgi:hypothetical protein
MSSFLRSSLKRPLAAALLLGSLCGTSARASTIDLTPLEGESVNGVTLGDVTFGYTELGSPSPEAFGQNIGTGDAQYVQGAAVVGFTDGVLTLSFADPVWQLSFAVAETTNAPLTPGFSVSAYDSGGGLVEGTSIDTNPLVLLSEGQFSYVGLGVSSVAISFDSVDADEFAFGGLSATVPEPAGIAVFAAGLMALGVVVARRRQV